MSECDSYAGCESYVNVNHMSECESYVKMRIICQNVNHLLM